MENKEAKEKFQENIREKIGRIEDLTEASIEEVWQVYKIAITTAAAESVNFERNKDKTWLSQDTKKRINERKALKLKLISTMNGVQKKRLEEEYRNKNKEVKRSARKDKKLFVEQQAEEAAKRHDTRKLYEISRNIIGKKNIPKRKIKSKTGEICSTEEEIKNRWIEYFIEKYKEHDTLESRQETERQNTQLNLNLTEFSKEEIRKAQKNGKAAGIDNIRAELITANIEISVETMYIIFQKNMERRTNSIRLEKRHHNKNTKKGDTTRCENWRPITLLCTASKIMTRIILELIKNTVEEKLRENQAGFRTNRSSVDQICTLRIILDQIAERGQNLYLNFIDFIQAFDSINRNKIWDISINTI